MRTLAADMLPPVRTITRGPRHHWFGYYDKLQFDPAGRRVLGMAVDFEHRSPRVGDTIRIGMVDLAADDRWTDLGTSGAWGWQQGCMLQWVPGTESQVAWNDREDGRFVTQVSSTSSRTGSWALTAVNAITLSTGFSPGASPGIVAPAIHWSASTPWIDWFITAPPPSRALVPCHLPGP